MATSIPRCAAASAALTGTAVGSGLGCQAHCSTNFLPRGSPSFSLSVSMSASPWQGCRRTDSRLITGLSQYLAKFRMIRSSRSTLQVVPLGKLRTASAPA